MSDVLIGPVEKASIVLADYDSRWPDIFASHAAILSRALGKKALSIEHAGSTSVTGLAAKPIIDVILVVEDSSDEQAYLPALEAADYVLRVREPDWYQHRMLRTSQRDVHVHVFSRGCVEIARMLVLRDRLRASPEDRQLYEATKRALAKEDWPDMNAYARAKTAVIEQIISRGRACGPEK